MLIGKTGTRRRAWKALATAGIGAAVLAAAIHLGSNRWASGSGTAAATPAALVAAAETTGVVDRWVAEAERTARESPDDADTHRRLAIAYMRKQRACGDPAYHERALGAIDRALRLEPGSSESLKLKAWVLAGGHRFAEARYLARRCIARRPKDAWSYGVLADALTELGDYPGAVAAAQQMIDRKPDLSSYARAAHLRELHGDPKGALELYALALDTTSARDPEAVAWLRVQRGKVRLGMGRAAAADAEYRQALAAQPGYHLALVGRARCQAALGNRRQAMRLYEQALAKVAEPVWMVELGDLKRAGGDRAGAEKQYAAARAGLAAEGPNADADRETAQLLADRGDPKAALTYARRAIRERNDIYTWDALAWALFKNSRFAEAWQASQQARRLGTRDAALLRHAAQIAARVPGKAGQAAKLLREARAIDPARAQAATAGAGERGTS
jgi:tetratricopeptide (TPR) repeat protein